MCFDTHEDGLKEVTVFEVLWVVTVKITVLHVIPLFREKRFRGTPQPLRPKPRKKLARSST
jgi:hypothetical protein